VGPVTTLAVSHNKHEVHDRHSENVRSMYAIS